MGFLNRPGSMPCEPGHICFLSKLVRELMAILYARRWGHVVHCKGLNPFVTLSRVRYNVGDCKMVITCA
jgi:hypothetical protein